MTVFIMEQTQRLVLSWNKHWFHPDVVL